jgi:hypothetical protein
VGDLKLATLEEGWIKNSFGPGGQRRQPGKRESCVEDGTYELQPHDTPAHPRCWAVVNPKLGVWHTSPPPGLPYGRSAILIHTGNTVADTEGCILVGVMHGQIGGVPAVFESRVAMEQLRAILGTRSHPLEIRPTAGTSEVIP